MRCSVHGKPPRCRLALVETTWCTTEKCTLVAFVARASASRPKRYPAKASHPVLIAFGDISEHAVWQQLQSSGHPLHPPRWSHTAFTFSAANVRTHCRTNATLVSTQVCRSASPMTFGNRDLGSHPSDLLPQWRCAALLLLSQRLAVHRAAIVGRRGAIRRGAASDSPGGCERSVATRTSGRGASRWMVS